MEYQGAVTLSKREQRIYVVIEKFRNGQYSREEAAAKLDLSTRQISRIAKKVREQGFAGVLHGNAGKVPWNKISQEKIDEYVKLYDEQYSKFNFAHALEMMALHHDMTELSYTRFRKSCRERGIGKVKKRRASKARLTRERHAEEGYMWQLDGSPHKWDGKTNSTLIGLIDDATSKIPGAELHPSETTWACMNVVREAIEKCGRPEFILTDRAGWSNQSGDKRLHFSQFVRACDELDITVVATSSPETKGRIERMNRTFQDRLVPELDLHKISGLTDANRYLKQVFVPTWNEKFNVEPAQTRSRYRPVEKHVDLREVFCIKKKRVVNKGHTISYAGKIYQIQPYQDENYSQKEVTIHEYEDKSISIFYANRRLIATEKRAPARRWRNVS